MEQIWQKILHLSTDDIHDFHVHSLRYRVEHIPPQQPNPLPTNDCNIRPVRLLLPTFNLVHQIDQTQAI